MIQKWRQLGLVLGVAPGVRKHKGRRKRILQIMLAEDEYQELVQKKGDVPLARWVREKALS